MFEENIKERKKPESPLFRKDRFWSWEHKAPWPSPKPDEGPAPIGRDCEPVENAKGEIIGASAKAGRPFSLYFYIFGEDADETLSEGEFVLRALCDRKDQADLGEARQAAAEVRCEADFAEGRVEADMPGMQAGLYRLELKCDGMDLISQSDMLFLEVR